MQLHLMFYFEMISLDAWGSRGANRFDGNWGANEVSAAVYISQIAFRERNNSRFQTDTFSQDEI